MVCPFPKRRQWTLLRAMLMTLVFLLHAVLLVTSGLALSFGSGGGIQIAATVLDLCSLFAVAMFYLGKIIYPQRKWDKKRNVCTFTGLTVFSFAIFVLFLARIPHSRFGSLTSDYETMGGKDVANIVVIVSSFAFAFAVIGLSAALISKYEDDPPSRSASFEFRTGPGFSYPSRSLSPDPIWDPVTMRAYNADGTPLDRPLAPPHVTRPAGWTDIRL